MIHLLTEALLHLARLLAAEDRKDRLNEWRDECQDVDRPIIHAANFVLSAAHSHPPFNPVALELPSPTVADLQTLRRLRRSILLLTAALTILAGLQMLVGSPDTTVLWFARTGAVLCIAAMAAWTGFRQDVPWLRATRAGSGLILGAVCLPPLLLTLLHAWSMWGGTWLATSVVLMIWDSYWSVQRPLKRRGLVSR